MTFLDIVGTCFFGYLSTVMALVSYREYLAFTHNERVGAEAALVWKWSIKYRDLKNIKKRIEGVESILEVLTYPFATILNWAYGSSEQSIQDILREMTEAQEHD